MARKIEFHELTHEFYESHTHLVEALDKNKQTSVFDEDKHRGYGVLLTEVEGYKFAIPVRSKMKINHRSNYTSRTYEEDEIDHKTGKKTGKKIKFRHGLDYSKAVIITEDRFISKTPFFLANKDDYVNITQNLEKIIIPQFKKYVQRYIYAVRNDDKNILKKYCFSTLQNYNQQLGC